jgi:hypothetical protein
MEFGQLTPEQRDRLTSMLNGNYDINPGQLLGQGFDALNLALDKPAVSMQRGMQRGAANLPGWAGGATKDAGGYLTRFAGSRPMQIGLKVGTGLGAVGGVLGAGDILLGNDSVANKVMDTAAMGIGGFLGMAGGPVGAAAGAGLGKMGSDSLQWLFGDKKTAEQRQMEQALAGLQGGRI